MTYEHFLQVLDGLRGHVESVDLAYLVADVQRALAVYHAADENARHYAAIVLAHLERDAHRLVARLLKLHQANARYVHHVRGRIACRRLQLMLMRLLLMLLLLLLLLWLSFGIDDRRIGMKRRRGLMRMLVERRAVLPLARTVLDEERIGARRVG